MFLVRASVSFLLVPAQGHSPGNGGSDYPDVAVDTCDPNIVLELGELILVVGALVGCAGAPAADLPSSSHDHRGCSPCGSGSGPRPGRRDLPASHPWPHDPGTYLDRRGGRSGISLPMPMPVSPAARRCEPRNAQVR